MMLKCELWAGYVVWINTIMSPFRTYVIICHCNNHLFHICWIVTEWMGEELKFKELTAIRCLLRPEGKEVLGEWGCQRCDILIGTNLQICLPTNLFIVLSGNVARLFAGSHETSCFGRLGFLETKMQRQHPILLLRQSGGIICWWSLRLILIMKHKAASNGWYFMEMNVSLHLWRALKRQI